MDIIDSTQESEPKRGFYEPPVGFNIAKNLLILLGNIILGAFVAALFSLVFAVLWGYDFASLTDLLSGYETEADPNLFRWILGLNQAFTFLLPGILTAFIIYKKDWIKYLFMNRSPSTTNWGLAAIILFCALPLVQYTYFINQQIPLPESWLAQEESTEAILKIVMTYNAPYEIIFNVFLIGVLPALGEEIVFRGIIQKNIQWIFNKPHLAIWIAAFIFSFIHLQFAGFIPRLILGAVLGYLFYFTQNLWVPIIAHFFNNASQVLLDFFFKEEMSSIDIESIESVPWYAGLVSLVLVVALLGFLRKINLNQTEQHKPI